MKNDYKLDYIRHGEKLPPRENFKAHGSAPCFCSNNGSTFILKMAKKFRNLMEKWTVPLRLWRREVFNHIKFVKI